MVYKLQKPRQRALGPIHPMDFNGPIPIRDIEWAGYPRRRLPQFELPSHEEQLNRSEGFGNLGDIIADIKSQAEAMLPIPLLCMSRPQVHDYDILQRLPRETCTPQSHLQDIPTIRNFNPTWDAPEDTRNIPYKRLPLTHYYLPVPTPPKPHRPPPKAPSSRNFVPLFPVPESPDLQEESSLPSAPSFVYSRRRVRTAPRKVANGRLTGFTVRKPSPPGVRNEKEEPICEKAIPAAVAITALAEDCRDITTSSGREEPTNEVLETTQEQSSDQKSEPHMVESENNASSSDEKSGDHDGNLEVPAEDEIPQHSSRPVSTTGSNSPQKREFWESADKLLAGYLRGRAKETNVAFWANADQQLVEKTSSSTHSGQTKRSRTEEWLEGIEGAGPPPDEVATSPDDCDLSWPPSLADAAVTSRKRSRRDVVTAVKQRRHYDKVSQRRNSAHNNNHSTNSNSNSSSTSTTDPVASLKRKHDDEQLQLARRKIYIEHMVAVTKREREQRRQRRKDMGW